MFHDSFLQWFKEVAKKYGLDNVQVKFVQKSELGGDLGKYLPSKNTIYIADNLSLRDTYDVAMHELAHAIVFKKRSSFFIKNNGQIYVDPNHTLANLDLLHLQANNGHGEEWRRIANALGADTSSFAIHKHHNLSLPELLGFRRSKH